MGRARAILQDEFPYGITATNINKEWFRIPMETVWNIFCQELYLTHILHELQIYSFVLMSNHFHLIASTPKANISQCMHLFMGNVSRRLNEAGNRSHGNFCGRHFKTVLDHPNYFLNAYKYFYRNPVTAGICSKVEEYPYSTLFGLLGKARLNIPLNEDTQLFTDVESCLNWLNQKPQAEKLEAVRYALKRPYFLSKKSRRNNRPLLETDDIL